MVYFCRPLTHRFRNHVYVLTCPTVYVILWLIAKILAYKHDDVTAFG